MKEAFDVTEIRYHWQRRCENSGLREGPWKEKLRRSVKYGRQEMRNQNLKLKKGWWEAESSSSLIGITPGVLVEQI